VPGVYEVGGWVGGWCVHRDMTLTLLRDWRRIRVFGRPAFEVVEAVPLRFLALACRHRSAFTAIPALAHGSHALAATLARLCRRS
jgi:hypothetical protein